MAKLSDKEILELAKLAELELTSEELQKIPKELNSILDYVAILDKVDVKNLEPTYQVTGLNNVQRDDLKIDYKLNKEIMMSDLPDKAEDQIKVKRMIA
jgi:aspartyl-tRNA(Asn)/glutamyl-tRNA(Gln) amidotransferase subunit C